MSATTDTNRLVLVVLALLTALFFLPGLFMGLGMMGFGMPMVSPMMGPMLGGQFTGDAPVWVLVIGLVGQLLFVGLVVVLGYLVYRAVAGGDGTDPAIEELRRAYARGEVDDDEFERRRDRLQREQ